MSSGNTKKLRWGILSTANIGRKRVIPGIKKSTNGVVAAVASRNMENAQRFAAENDIPRAYGSYEELISDPEVDAIYNPLPNDLHAPLSILCAEAGIPVLCEKPLALDAAEAQSLVDEFIKRDIPFAEAFMYRFHPRTQRVKKMLAEGVVGDIIFMRASFTFPIQSEDNIRLQKHMGGGSLMDVGCYCINVMRLMTGEEPQAVSAVANIGKRSEVDEALAGTLQFPSGIIGHFDCGFRAPYHNEYEIRGSEGRILVREGFVNPIDNQTSIKWWHGENFHDITIPAADHYQLMVEDFANVVLLGQQPAFDSQDAVRNMDVIDRLLASIP